MKSRFVVSFVVASLLGSSVAAFAQPRPNDQRRARPAATRPAPPSMRREAPLGRAGGPIPHQDWQRGDRLPPQYRERNYVVDDWRGHGLSAPPRGYQWIGVNGDYVLAAVATGVIASIFVFGR